MGRATIRRHVELCSGCADYAAAVRGQRAALAIALPVAPAAAGLRAAVLGSAAGGSGLGAAVGAGGATSAAGGLAGLGVNGVAARSSWSPRSLGAPAWHAMRPSTSPSSARVVSATPAGTCDAAARRSAADDDGRRHGGATALRAPRAATATAPRPRGTRLRRSRRSARPPGSAVPATTSDDAAAPAATGKAAAPGQLKAPGAPAQGKALGHAKTKADAAKPARVKPGGANAPGRAGEAPKAKAVSSAPAKPPKPAKGPRLPGPAHRGADAPEPSAALPPGQAKKQDDPRRSRSRSARATGPRRRRAALGSNLPTRSAS